MGRHGYTDEPANDWKLIRWRGQVASAMRGRRGQGLLRDLLDALDAMPRKRLIAREFWNGEACALGALGERRGIDLISVDTEDYDRIADTFGIARQVVMEIEFMNDEAGAYRETPEERWIRMRNWVASELKENWPAPQTFRASRRTTDDSA